MLIARRALADSQGAAVSASMVYRNSAMDFGADGLADETEGAGRIQETSYELTIKEQVGKPEDFNDRGPPRLRALLNAPISLSLSLSRAKRA